MNNSPKQQTEKSFPQLIYKSPILLLVLFWFSLVAIATIGLVGLIHPGVESSESQPIPTVPKPTEISEEEAKLPIWFFVGIFLGCSGGSLLITYALKYLTLSWQENQPSTSTKTKVKKRQLTQKNPQNFRLKVQPTANLTQEKQPITATNLEEPRITVVSPQESIPLEKKEPTLAETMDLRKHRSLASLLRNS